jgi:photosystem II stability/assembly factor-like uncharacterized protein
VFVVGSKDVILHYNGKTWYPIEVGATLYGIWVASESDAFAVGVSGTIMHYDGKTWKKMNSGINDYLTDVWGSSATDVYAVGHSGTIIHYDGISWNRIASPVKVNLRSISGVSESCIYAVGGSGTIVQFDGQRWKVLMEKDAKSHWNGVHAFPDGEVRVVGWDGRTGGIEMYYYDNAWGDARTSISIGKWSEIESVWGFSPTNYFTVGLDGIRHRFK